MGNVDLEIAREVGDIGVIFWQGGRYAWDVTLEETHTGKLFIPEHPVEDGPDTTDGPRKELDRLTLEVFVSNTPVADKNNLGFGLQDLDIQKYLPTPPSSIPINPAGALTALAGAAVTAIGNAIFGGPAPIKARTYQWTNGEHGLVEYAYFTFKWLQDYRKLVGIVTSKAAYENMMLEGVEMRRSKEDGTGARFRLEFRQIRTVKLSFTDAPIVDEPRQESATPKGTQGTTDAPPDIYSFGYHLLHNPLSLPGFPGGK